MEKQSLLGSYNGRRTDVGNTSFEEDDGFIYKRGGHNNANVNDDDDAQPQPSKRGSNVRSPGSVESQTTKRKQFDSPFTRLDVRADALSREFANLSESTEDSLSDLNNSSKRITQNVMQPSQENGQARSKRRVSYHKRGKRVLSIGNGLVAEPHRDVLPQDYYKLLDTSSSGPDRMQQLLVWCYRKKLQQDDQISGRGVANVSSEQLVTNNITRVICEEVLTALIENNVSTSWYPHSKTKLAAPRKKIVVPNASNAANKQSLHLFTDRLNQIRHEQQQWRDAHAHSESSLVALEAAPAQLLTPSHMSRDADNTGDRENVNIGAEIAESCTHICTKSDGVMRAANILCAAGHRATEALHAAAAISHYLIAVPASTALVAHMSRVSAPHLEDTGITVRDLLLRLRHHDQNSQE